MQFLYIPCPLLAPLKVIYYESQIKKEYLTMFKKIISSFFRLNFIVPIKLV